ncbi:MAG: 2-C-methyl-D-erythritol 2,4-cyclodiphosphate synthase [Clostridiales Family XIII bacterium]|jgi:2-C-methyl-D-erythritol 4-phosphate cytidylyltransferase/2-C-methyl-D-erythritol 2,4-cyclodiphosphate synthase|nr:2-C-methyl-D-erythritol 2,4-cyclodiphosphate synthase [Clostridiales Family XIII bacterium]
MHGDKRVTAIIAAGGTGSRFGAGQPKQYLKVGQVSILGRSLSAFLDGRVTDAAVIAVPEGLVGFSADVLLEDFGDAFVAGQKNAGRKAGEAAETILSAKCLYLAAEDMAKPVLIVPGGSDRTASVKAALDALRDEKAFLAAGGSSPSDGYVLIHDAARPYVSEELINSVADAASMYGAAVPCVALRDTVYRASEEGFPASVDELCDRKRLAAAQTPQGFAFSVISEALDRGAAEGKGFTDEGSAVIEYGGLVKLVEGDSANTKITTADDLAHSGGEYRAGIGFDAHAFGPAGLADAADVSEGLILGGVEIPFERRLVGHSDADVLAHALMDAILGAVSRGDIGLVFPDTDDRYLGASSMGLLDKTLLIMKEEGYSLVNADLTLVAEKPRLAPYRREIIEKLAAALDVDPKAVSIKATTTEKLGFTGREEGIGAQAVVMLRKSR